MRGWPVRWAPTTATRVSGWSRPAIRASRSSVNAGPISITPNGRPFTSPAGTATAARSKRLVELVKRPRRALAPRGSAATSARVGWPGVVGSSRASASDSSAQGAAAEGGQAVGVGVEPVGRDVAGAGDDAGDRGVQALDAVGDRLVDKTPHCRVALGDERALVEHRGCLGEGGEVQRADVGAGRFELPYRGLVRLRPARVQFAELTGRRDGDAPGARGALGEGREGAVRRGGHEGQCLFGLRERAGEYRHAVEGGAGRDHARRRDQAAGRLEADDAVEGGRDPARARGVRAQGEVDDAESHGDRRAGAGAAADARGVVGVAHRAVRRARAHQARRELVEVRGAQHDRTGGAQPGDHRCVGLGAGRRTPGSPRWWAGRPRRCCPSPRTDARRAEVAHPPPRVRRSPGPPPRPPTAGAGRSRSRGGPRPRCGHRRHGHGSQRTSLAPRCGSLPFASRCSRPSRSCHSPRSDGVVRRRGQDDQSRPGLHLVARPGQDLRHHAVHRRVHPGLHLHRLQG